ncbi:MAG TPA: hypothetical protein VFQ02_04735, partial [Nitrospira sp.]|nr:hypothetical protein [Nitrospira sp.]
ELIDVIGRIIEVLGVRTFEIPVEMQPEAFGQEPLLDSLFGFFKPEGDVFQLLSDLAGCVFGPCVGKERPGGENASDE